MADDLGSRLLRSGLVTRDQLAESLARAAEHGGALIEALAARGVPEDALAGFFVAEGFGPMTEPRELDAVTAATARRLPARMAVDLVALPVRATPAGLVVAMAAPSDRHAVREIARAIGGSVLPVVACVGPLRSAIERAYPDGPPLRRLPSERPPVDAPVLELVQRRPGERRPLLAAPPAPRLPTLPGPGAAGGEEDVAVPLVRAKGLPATGAGVAAKAARVITKSFARPDHLPKKPPSAPPPADPDEGRATAEFRVPRGGSAPFVSVPASPEARAARLGRSPVATAPPAARSATPRRSSKPAAGYVAAEDDRWELVGVPQAIAGQTAGEPAPSSSAPPPVSGDAPSSGARRIRASEELPSAPPSFPEIGSTLAAMRVARDRDEVVRLACEGAVTVARAAVFLALRKDVLKGWDGAGDAITRDGVRNLWIPTTSPSTFKNVIDSREPYVGPYGTAIADGLFRAAVGSRGGMVAAHPIAVGDRVVGVLAIDDLVAHGSVPGHRIELLAHAVAEAFKRIIAEKKA
jgi:hypothetical protein